MICLAIGYFMLKSNFNNGVSLIYEVSYIVIKRSYFKDDQYSKHNKKVNTTSSLNFTCRLKKVNVINILQYIKDAIQYKLNLNNTFLKNIQYDAMSISYKIAARLHHASHSYITTGKKWVIIRIGISVIIYSILSSMTFYTSRDFFRLHL